MSLQTEKSCFSMHYVLMYISDELTVSLNSYHHQVKKQIKNMFASQIINYHSDIFKQNKRRKQTLLRYAQQGQTIVHKK